MGTSPNAGKVQTVLGLVEPSALGITMTHEHLLVDLRAYFSEPEEPGERRRVYQPITLENLGWIRQNWRNSWPNLVLDDEELAVQEATYYRHAGGGTMVDLTNKGLGRDPTVLARMSRATGLHIVMGSGYYVARSHPPGFERKNEEQIAEEIVRDCTEGVGTTGIKAGIIGEIGISWPMAESERLSLEAAVEAQRRTGAALSIHVGAHPDSPSQVLGVLQKKRAELSRTILCHIDRTLEERSALKELAQSGATLEFDVFGLEVSYLPGNYLPMLSDAQRLQKLEWLIEDGFLKQIVVSQDVGTKTRLVRYGGTGYAHILRYVVPWMRDRGFTQEHIDALLVENPRPLLSLA
jgi:phosphotriesterase-related protein